MSNTTDNFPDDDANQPRGLRVQLETSIAERDAARTEAETFRTQLDTLQRQSAFRDAGLDPSNKQHAIYMKAYDGELASDKIRTDAEDAGFLTPLAPTVSDGELNQQFRMDRASVEAPPTDLPNSDAAVLKNLFEASRKGKSKDFWDQARAAGLALQG